MRTLAATAPSTLIPYSLSASLSSLLSRLPDLSLSKAAKAEETARGTPLLTARCLARSAVAGVRAGVGWNVTTLPLLDPGRFFAGLTAGLLFGEDRVVTIGWLRFFCPAGEHGEYYLQ